MTDADYHSWRKPITLVITAPSGPLSVEWNALQNSLCILLAAFCISSMLIPLVWVLIAQAMGPSRASEPSLAPMSFCFTKQGGRASRRRGWITFSSVCLLSLFKTKPFYFGPLLTALSQRPWTRKLRSPVVVWETLLQHFYEQKKQRLIQTFCYRWFCFPKQICYKTREAEITHDGAASLGCTKTTDQAESQVRDLSVC